MSGNRFGNEWRMIWESIFGSGNASKIPETVPSKSELSRRQI